MSERGITPEDFRRCYGWAYETCGLVATWVGIEVMRNGSWSAQPYCSRHAADFVADTSRWTEQPESRTLIEASVARAIWRGPDD